MVTYFFKTKIDICQSFQSHFYSFYLKKKLCIYCRIRTWNSCILYCEPYVAIFEIEVVQKNKRKKITRIIQCNPYQDVRNCAFNWKHARYINFDSKYKYVEICYMALICKYAMDSAFVLLSNSTWNALGLWFAKFE